MGIPVLLCSTTQMIARPRIPSSAGIWLDGAVVLSAARTSRMGSRGGLRPELASALMQKDGIIVQHLHA